MTFENIDFSKLPDAERLLLAEALLDSLYDTHAPSPEQQQELERRVQAIDNGEVKLLSQEEFHAQLAHHLKNK